MDEVLQQLEHHTDSKKVQSFISFSTLDVLEYLRQEAAQPNDHSTASAVVLHWQRDMASSSAASAWRGDKPQGCMHGAYYTF